MSSFFPPPIFRCQVLSGNAKLAPTYDKPTTDGDLRALINGETPVQSSSSYRSASTEYKKLGFSHEDVQDLYFSVLSAVSSIISRIYS